MQPRLLLPSVVGLGIIVALSGLAQCTSAVRATMRVKGQHSQLTLAQGLVSMGPPALAPVRCPAACLIVFVVCA